MLQITNTKINNRQIDAVSAKDLYLTLGLDKSNWNRWVITNIAQNEFFHVGKDWEGFVIKTNGNETTDYLISLDMAKHLAMMARTDKSHEVRNYFIECEKTQHIKLPQTFSEALQLAADQAKQLELQAPLVTFANTVQSSSALVDMKDLAKLISDTTIKIGRNTLMKLLRDRGFLNKDNTPSQKAVDADLMKAVEKTWTNPKTEEVELTVVAQCTGKGQIYFCNNVRKFLEVK